MTNAQTPIGSGFGMRSTTDDVLDGIDLTGKTALVTGGYSGVGLATTCALAQGGAHVIVGARRPEIALAALDGIAGVSIIALDLAVPASIDEFARAVAARTGTLDILINNAAIMANPLTRDARGYESQFATNHLGHFQLTARLWPLLRAAGEGAGARVVMLSSIGHARAGVDLDDPHFNHRAYDKWTAYAHAKSANALFAVQLDIMGAPSGVRAFAVHPGGIMTPLQRHLTHEEQVAMGWFDADGKPVAIFKSPEAGAATSVWCATSPQLNGIGGVYCEDCDIAPLWHEGLPRFSGVRPHAIDPGIAAQLWAASERMIDLKFVV
jgi:NAD(P)-dependent dehydrogenase (short-subunit alcohol dehydrogenase family)